MVDGELNDSGIKGIKSMFPDHPWFFHFLRSGHACDDFRLLGGLFYLCRFCGTVFVPCSDFFVSRLAGMDRYNKLVP